MHLLLSTTVAAIATIVGVFAVRQRGLVRVLAWPICFIVVALSPALVPPKTPGCLAAALVASCFLPKLIDLFCTREDLTRYSFWFLLAWLPSCFWLVLRRVPPTVSRADDQRRLLTTLAQSTISLILAVLVFRTGWSSYPFAIEHSIKVIVTYAAVVSLARCLATIWRLSGGRAVDPMLSPWSAATPADFWRRWNRAAQSFFEEYAFRPAGGLRHPVRGTLVAFAASGVLHEYVFGIAAGQWQGVQLAFFMIQGLATIATARLRPTGSGLLPGVLLTMAFNLLTSVLFFQSVNDILPFYTARSVV